MRKRLLLLVVLLLLIGGVAYYVVSARQTTLTLTGIVTTNDVIVSPQIAGQLGRLLVKEGDTVNAGQLVATIKPDELRADLQYSQSSAEALKSQVRESEA